MTKIFFHLHEKPWPIALNTLIDFVKRKYGRLLNLLNRSHFVWNFTAHNSLSFARQILQGNPRFQIVKLFISPTKFFSILLDSTTTYSEMLSFISILPFIWCGIKWYNHSIESDEWDLALREPFWESLRIYAIQRPILPRKGENTCTTGNMCTSPIFLAYWVWSR